MKKNIILILFLFCKCDCDGGCYMSFYNNSGKPVCYLIPLRYGIFYPDTSLPELPIEYIITSIVNKESHGSLSYHTNQLFPNLSSIDTISIFFFCPDTLSKYEWETIRKEYKILMRYDFSYTDFQKLNWEVYYPPTEVMKDMKMFPPYQEKIDDTD